MSVGSQAERASISALKDRHCVFREKSVLWYVSVSKATADDWGVSLVLKVIPMPGFTSCDHPEFDVSGRWDIMSVSPLRLHASYVGWTLFIEPDRVEKTRFKARECPNSAELYRYALSIN